MNNKQRNKMEEYEKVECAKCHKLVSKDELVFGLCKDCNYTILEKIDKHIKYGWSKMNENTNEMVEQRMNDMLPKINTEDKIRKILGL